MQASPAFTVVPVRRAFARPAPAPPIQMVTENPKPQKTARDWPPSVRQYVQRSFAETNTIAGIEKSEMEAKLKKIISDAAESNTLLTIDWDHLPLPQQMLQAERNNFYAMPIASTSDQLSNLNMHETNVSSNGNSKKRKSSDLAHETPDEKPQPPWRSTNNQNAFGSRLSYPDKRPRTEGFTASPSKFQVSLESRKRRFEENGNGSTPMATFHSSKEISPVGDGNLGPIVGRCQVLEKKYFRLTSAPNPDTVRPLEVLEKTLDLLKDKWRKDNNYSYICDQFKSLRQDLTVQHIKTDFTVNVYEIHARIALEKGDLGEYNQCQTQLRALYAQKLGGHPVEFKAYRILYFLHTRNRTDMNDVLADLTPAEKQTVPIQHALEARSSLALGNYHRFFKLYIETPNMGAYLMDMFATRERLAALVNICKAYKPDVKLRFFTEELGFESDSEAARFLCDQGGQDFLEDRDGEVRLITGKSVGVFEVARKAAFGKVDIKGQI